MKRFRTWVDAIFTALLGMFGFCGCDGYVSPVICEYGVPHAVLTVDVKVTNESDKPLKNIQLQLNPAWKDGMGTLYVNGSSLLVYTDSVGSYSADLQSEGARLIRLVSRDTSGVYAPDTLLSELSYSGGDGRWDEGAGSFTSTIVMKKASIGDASLLVGNWQLDRFVTTSESLDWSGMQEAVHEHPTGTWIISADSITYAGIHVNLNDIGETTTDAAKHTSRYSVSGSANLMTLTEEGYAEAAQKYRVRLLTSDRLELETKDVYVKYVDSSVYTFVVRSTYCFSRK